MVTVNDIGWSSYGSYEGPRYIGSKKYVLPVDPTFDQKAMSVVSASEGNAGSVNMYDRAILSVGFIQWIELGQYSVSNMIGKIAEDCGIEFVLERLKPALAMAKATFKRTPNGLWRFHIPHPTTGVEAAVDTESLSRWLFSRGSGKVGTWTETNKLWAKVWASCIANLFEEDIAIASQVAWTVPQLRQNFVRQNGKSIVFGLGSSYDGYPGVVKAILVAYGVNNPAEAERVISLAAERSRFTKWTMQWCLDMVHDLALTSSIPLWPTRYNYKRPALELAFGVTLPKDSKELALRLWQQVPIVEPPSAPSSSGDSAGEVEFPTSDDEFTKPTTTSSSPVGIWQTFWNVASSIADSLKRR